MGYYGHVALALCLCIMLSLSHSLMNVQLLHPLHFLVDAIEPHAVSSFSRIAAELGCPAYSLKAMLPAELAPLKLARLAFSLALCYSFPRISGRQVTP